VEEGHHSLVCVVHHWRWGASQSRHDVVYSTGLPPSKRILLVLRRLTLALWIGSAMVVNVVVAMQKISGNHQETHKNLLQKKRTRGSYPANSAEKGFLTDSATQEVGRADFCLVHEDEANGRIFSCARRGH
jgi:hypothetical protein